MLVIVRPLVTEFARRASSMRIAWSALAVVFVVGAVWSTFLVLRDAPVGPPGHGGQLQAFLPIVHGKPVLYAGQDRYAAYELLGADTHVPLVEFPDDAVSPNPEKPFDTGDAYSPIDFDSFNRGTLDRFPYVITSRGAWNSQNPPNFRRIAKTPSFILWERTGPTPHGRHVLLEGTEAGARAHCNSPEVRILLGSGGRASLFGETQVGTKPKWSNGSILGTGESTSQTLDLPKGTWDLSLQYFAPFALSITAPPQLDQPQQQRPVLARGQIPEPRREGRIHDRRRLLRLAAEPHRLGRQGLRRRDRRHQGRTSPHRAAERGLRPVDRLVRRPPVALI
jgi:hypothetical protein